MEYREDRREMSDYNKIDNYNSEKHVGNVTTCNGTIHTVEKGDTLYLLSKRYNVPLSLLMRANQNVNVYNLQVGTNLCIPSVKAAPPMTSGMKEKVEVPMVEKQPAKVKNQFVVKVEKKPEVAPAPCPACPEAAPCPEQQPCPEAAPCPACPEQQPCPEPEPCPTCPVCPACPACPACPVCPSCPEPVTCPVCPKCPEPEPCPTCPEQQPCPEAAPCPSCPEQQTCPACDEKPIQLNVENHYTVVLPVQETKPCKVCPKKESNCDCLNRFRRDFGCKKYYRGDDNNKIPPQCGNSYGGNFMNMKCGDFKQCNTGFYHSQNPDRKSIYYRDTMPQVKPYRQIRAHVVMEHESLEDILRRYHMTMEEILECNRTREIKLCPGKVILVKR